MPRIAITGHMNLSPETIPLVRQEITDRLLVRAAGDLVGISCLARGADSIFAEAVLDRGGKLEVVLPSPNYRTSKVKPDHAPLFDFLLSRADAIHTAPIDHANRIAYEAANRILLSSCDELFAVWDGDAGVDRGSTASVVAQARQLGIPVEVIWPDGAARTYGDS